MKIGIAGAGFAGLGAAYHLRHHDVTLFDPNGPGGGASGVSAGLLHPFTGGSGRINPRGREAMQETLRLLRAAEEALGKPVCKRSGIIRSPTTDAQKRLFSQMPLRYDGLRWDGKNLHIDCGITIFPKLYLEGLLKASGVRFVKEPLSGTFDHTILATGKDLDPQNLPVQFVKGQLLRFQGTLEKSTLAEGYSAPTEDPNIWSFGATFEHHFTTAAPDIDRAKELLRPKWRGATFTPVGCDAGIRVVNKKGPFPIIHRKDPHTWILTGFGVRGLLYHALVGKEVAALLSECEAETIDNPR